MVKKILAGTILSMAAVFMRQAGNAFAVSMANAREILLPTLRKEFSQY